MTEEMVELECPACKALIPVQAPFREGMIHVTCPTCGSSITFEVSSRRQADRRDSLRRMTRASQEMEDY
jgi:predicted RNA-binding Zn-ribbon protein involved in translation (DUF1610 family)